MPFLQLDKASQEILAVVSEYCDRLNSQYMSPWTELNALYTVIMERIPKDVLPNAQLLLALLKLKGSGGNGHDVALLCNVLGLSEFVFKGILEHLHAVLYIQQPMRPVVFDSTIEPTLLCFEQQSASCIDCVQKLQILQEVYGIIKFHHKSFNDLLIQNAHRPSVLKLQPCTKRYSTAYIRAITVTRNAMLIETLVRLLFLRHPCIVFSRC
ncbi:hypothetical protein AN958_02519 [Leucoagaricus sp. SymC.cos]|nr:hypothetical protein AN958_02519 [Leucoagaricus sp. SymC.cos]